MGRIIELRPDSAVAQVAGAVPRAIVLPANLLGRERTVMILPERVAHIRRRRPQWLAFCLAHTPDVLSAPDYIGQQAHGDRRRVEFVRLIERPPRWLLVSVKFLDDKAEAWVNSAYPIADAYLTRRVRGGTLWRVTRGP
ncbi:MAG: hypothetical protein ACREMC_09235 [Gemmatimonadales bacterium]